MNYEKLAKVFQRYLDLLAVRKKRSKGKKGNFGNSFRSKERLIRFFDKNGEWPSKNSPYVIDKQLALRLENYLSKASPMYDPVLRRIVLATGRKPSGKRPHNPALFKEEILEFTKLHGRAPMRYKTEIVPGEGNLKAKLDYYTLINKDMAFLGKMYALDKCHRSGIPNRFRPLINSQLDVEKPLIRLVKEQQQQKENENE